MCVAVFRINPSRLLLLLLGLCLLNLIKQTHHAALALVHQVLKPLSVYINPQISLKTTAVAPTPSALKREDPQSGILRAYLYRPRR